MDPRKHNGAVLLGLNGIVVKSHGGTDSIGFAHAVDLASEMTSGNYIEVIKEHMTKLKKYKIKFILFVKEVMLL